MSDYKIGDEVAGTLIVKGVITHITPEHKGVRHLVILDNRGDSWTFPEDEVTLG